MGKSRRGSKELSKEQELKYEGKELRNHIRDLEGIIRELEKDNRNLRRQMAGSRKELAKIDLDRYSYVREIVEEHLSLEEESMDSTRLLEKMKAKWKCLECHSGHLEIILYTKMGQTWYWRQCSECENRTKSQPHHPGVEGIPKESQIEMEKPKQNQRNRK